MDSDSGNDRLLDKEMASLELGGLEDGTSVILPPPPPPPPPPAAPQAATPCPQNPAPQLPAVSNHRLPGPLPPHLTAAAPVPHFIFQLHPYYGHPHHPHKCQHLGLFNLALATTLSQYALKFIFHALS